MVLFTKLEVGAAGDNGDGIAISGVPPGIRITGAPGNGAFTGELAFEHPTQPPEAGAVGSAADTGRIVAPAFKSPCDVLAGEFTAPEIASIIARGSLPFSYR